MYTTCSCTTAIADGAPSVPTAPVPAAAAVLMAPPRPRVSAVRYGPGPRSARGPEDPRPRARPLPHRPDACPVARRTACELLDGHDVPDDVKDDVLLIVSELVTNAVCHALAPVALRLSTPSPGTVRIEVSDGGPRAASTPREPGDGGRGLALVCALAKEHGRTAGPAGATSWAEVSWPGDVSEP
jgi:hypothetical protein